MYRGARFILAWKIYRRMIVFAVSCCNKKSIAKLKYTFFRISDLIIYAGFSLNIY